MLNEVLLQGRFVKDPELRRTQAGDAVTSFTLAVERDIPNRDGTRETDYIDCVVWRKTAEFVDRNFAKGKMSIVRGRLTIRKFEDKDGNKRSKAEVVADSVYFGESRSGENPPAYEKPAEKRTMPVEEVFTQIDESGLDLPF